MGPYQVLAPIGKGGMGVVYLSRDNRDGRLVALKVLSPRKAEGRMLARFQREMEISRKVDHAHVALTYDTGKYHGVYYIAMEYIPGKNLYRVVAEPSGPLRTARAARLFAEVASGLHHAHEQGLVHRDLKPSNIMVTPHDHAKVLDLGLAIIQGEEVARSGRGRRPGLHRRLDGLHRPGADHRRLEGRPPLRRVRPGLLLYFAVSGKPPFPGGTNVDKIHCHRTQEPVPLLHLNPSLPLPFVQIVGKMMAKDPARRYATAKAVEEDLRAWAAGEAVQPLDDPADSDFLEAVAVLQAAEPPTDVTFTNLGIVDWKQAVAEAEEPDAGSGAPWWKRWKRPPTWVLTLAVGLGLVLLVEFVLVVLAFVMLGRK